MLNDQYSIRIEIRLMGLMILVGLCLWWPASRDIRQLEAEVVQTQQRLSGVNGQAYGVMALSMDVQRMRQTLAGDHRLIPRRSDLGPLLGSLSNRLEELGMTDLRISTPEGKVHVAYVVQPIDVEFTGYSMDVLEWIEHVEWLPRLVQIKAMQLRVDAETGRVRAEIKLETYYYTAGGEVDS